MSKRRNDNTLKDDTPAAKRTRKPSGFRVARPPVAENSNSSTSSRSRITTLVRGTNGRLGGKHKHKNRLTSKNPPNQLLQCPLNLILQPKPQLLMPAPRTCLNICPKMLSRQPHLMSQWSQNPNERETMILGYVFWHWLILRLLSTFILKSKLQEWLSLRDTTLDEILRHDGLGDYLGHPLCCVCNIQPGLFKCKDCSGGGRLRCQSCVVKVHQDMPLHRIEVSRYFNWPIETVSNTTSYCSDGPVIISTRLPSKFLVSAYN